MKENLLLLRSPTAAQPVHFPTLPSPRVHSNSWRTFLPVSSTMPLGNGCRHRLSPLPFGYSTPFVVAGPFRIAPITRKQARLDRDHWQLVLMCLQAGQSDQMSMHLRGIEHVTSIMINALGPAIRGGPVNPATIYIRYAHATFAAFSNMVGLSHCAASRAPRVGGCRTRSLRCTHAQCISPTRQAWCARSRSPPFRH